jgi:hypothetical protein
MFENDKTKVVVAFNEHLSDHVVLKIIVWLQLIKHIVQCHVQCVRPSAFDDRKRLKWVNHDPSYK